MTSAEIRQKFLDFFEKRGHKIIPSASLVPENDSSVLFTTAGMQQFKPYFTGSKNPMQDFGTLNVASVQKCLRTSDIDEVGDESHLTFFEMLGNFSFGGYWKEEAIQYGYDFITKELGLKIDYVSVFGGTEGISADTESEEIWKKVDPKLKIVRAGMEDNFWGPTGDEGPCGPTTEIYVDGVEIWNIVLNEFYRSKDKSLKPLKTKGVDTGMGLERLAVVVQKKNNVFETDLFDRFGNPETREGRIVADHVRAAEELIKDGVQPSNTDRGYVLRRLIRRAVRYADIIGKSQLSTDQVFIEEEKKFRLTLSAGLRKFNKTIGPLLIGWEGEKLREAKPKFIPPEIVFDLITTDGFPIEMVKEEAKNRSLFIDELEVARLLERHREVSRIGSTQKFKGGLADTSEMSIKYHTATHLLNAALRQILGSEVMQKGSNITPERLRFDFSFSRKLTPEEVKKVEDLVNEKITEDLPVSFQEMSKDAAEKTGAVHAFGEKYGDMVKVYSIGDEKRGFFSREFCGGPHVARTGVLGRFKITKEEAVSAGVRRIKAVLE